jgi:hypothetical protein
MLKTVGISTLVFIVLVAVLPVRLKYINGGSSLCSGGANVPTDQAICAGANLSWSDYDKYFGEHVAVYPLAVALTKFQSTQTHQISRNDLLRNVIASVITSAALFGFMQKRNKTQLKVHKR